MASILALVAPAESLRKKAGPRLFTIMHTLLYPGVLGSLMYALPDNIASGRVHYSPEQTGLACALFAMFVMDYAHSVLKENEAAYSYGTFVADLFIVIFLFLAGQRILGTAIFAHVHPAWWLCAMKLASVGWEWLKHPSPAPSGEAASESQQDKANAMGTDFAFLLVYALVGVGAQISGRPATLALTLALVADAFYYVAYRWLKRRTGKQDARTATGGSNP
jgi:hypothetical protein